MGGKALNKYGVFTERKNAEEYLKIGKEIQDRLAIDMTKETFIVQSYTDKADHGDLDILIKEVKNSILNWRKYIELVFKPQAIYKNANVYSFDYQNFQIDIILINEDKWEIAKTYFNFDPLSNCLGKTFHKFNLSYGWDGLFYKYRYNDGRCYKNILLTTDPRRIFEFGGFDYDRYLQGFETLEDIFKFIINGKYFDNRVFQMENLNRIDRKRNAKRKSYHQFLKYIKDNNINIKYNFLKDKDMYLPLIISTFNDVDVLGEIYEQMVKETIIKNIRNKFNGNIIMRWFPELTGKELGSAIKEFKNLHGDNFNDFILDSSTDAIKENFCDFYKNSCK